MYIWRKRATTKWLAQHTDKLLARFGTATAIIELPGKMRTLLEVSCGTKAQALDLQRELGGAIEKLRANWLARFANKSQVKPVRIGGRTIVIPAEAAFGTGEHATTAMCLRILERVTRNRGAGWFMLDAGTGSGILAIAGSYLGAKKVLAIDNDPLACAIARRNARANGVRNLEVRTGDVLRQKFAGQFDIITANLFSEVLIAALPGWSRRLAENGRLILSGVLRSQERALVRALQRNDFAAREIRRRGKWVALLASPAGGK